MSNQMTPVKNSVATLKKESNKFSVKIQSEQYKNLINNTLGDPNRAKRFVAAISSAVATNANLSDCDAGTILSSALLGEALNLSPSPQLGQYYLVPFNDKTKGKVAQFQLGWKGYVQLAIRSGFYKKINVLEIKEGELIKWDPLNEDIEVKLIEDEDIRNSTNTIGYYAMYEYLNGFKKALYWTKNKMQNHAKEYSQGYRSDLAKNTRYTFWSKNFDDMAKKTMLRQLIGKWGIMSTEMQEAYNKDMAVIDQNNNCSYVDNVEEYEEEIIQQDEAEEKTIQTEVYDSNGEPILKGQLDINDL